MKKLSRYKDFELNEELDNLLLDFRIKNNIEPEDLIKMLKGFIEFQTKQI